MYYIHIILISIFLPSLSLSLERKRWRRHIAANAGMSASQTAQDVGAKYAEPSHTQRFGMCVCMYVSMSQHNPTPPTKTRLCSLRATTDRHSGAAPHTNTHTYRIQQTTRHPASSVCGLMHVDLTRVFGGNGRWW